MSGWKKKSTEFEYSVIYYHFPIQTIWNCEPGIHGTGSGEQLLLNYGEKRINGKGFSDI